METKTTDSDADVKFCNNCLHEIASVNFMMHELHCARNNVLCPHCKESVARSDLTQHIADNHVDAECKLCRITVKKDLMEQHQVESCKKRLVQCSFCELAVPFCSLADHEASCGSRTECCPLCDRYVMQQDSRLHELTKCALPDTAARRRNYPDAVGNDLEDDGGLSALINVMKRVNLDDAFPRRRNDLQSRSRDVKSSYVFDRQRNHDRVTNPHRYDHRVDRGRQNDHDDREVMPQHDREMIERKYDHDTAIEQDDDTENVPLPCEFCDQLIPAEDLILHQTGCTGQNDLIREREKFTHPHEREQRDRPRHYSREDVKQPVLKLNMNMKEVEFPEPEVFNMGYATHQTDGLGEVKFCEQIAKLPAEDVGSLTADEFVIPCEICGDRIVADQFLDHQEICNEEVQGL